MCCAQVTLVAKIVAVLDSATQVTYTLSDGTGRIETKMWIETDDLEGAAQARRERTKLAVAR